MNRFVAIGRRGEPVETINIVGSDILTGADVTAIWTEVLGRPIAYGGDDPGGFEASMANFMPEWMAYEMRIMAERYVSDGIIPPEGDHERLIKCQAVICILAAKRLWLRPDEKRGSLTGSRDKYQGG